MFYNKQGIIKQVFVKNHWNTKSNMAAFDGLKDFIYGYAKFRA